MTYFEAITEAMGMLSKVPNSIFVGQAVKYPGQAAFGTFDKVPMEKRLEMPVIEDFQMGFCTGLALNGYLPISFYPRMDFLILAMNQLVNHLDKWPDRPKVIIRTAVGRREPLDPGPQHVQNHTFGLRQMLTRVMIFELTDIDDILPAYEEAASCKEPVILVEHMSKYQ